MTSRTAALPVSARKPALGRALWLDRPEGTLLVTPLTADRDLLWTAVPAASLSRTGRPVDPRTLDGEVVLRDGRHLTLQAAGLCPQIRQGRLALRVVRRGIDWCEQAPGGRLELRSPPA
jgi:hypothetical protein